MLSDVYKEYGTDVINGILNKKDEELDGIDFNNLFNTNIPCGTLEEILYYIRASFNFLANDKEEHCTEMIENWSHFIMLNMSKFYSLNIHKHIINSFNI